MLKRLAIVASALMLGGCALPVPLQIASWAIDGLVLVATEKTVADHGVSMLAQRDCAMIRIATEGALCRDDIGVTAVAAQELPPLGGDRDERVIAVADAGGIVTDSPAVAADVLDPAAPIEQLAAFETAAGPVHGPSDGIPSDEFAIAEARWETIIAAPAFFDDPAEPLNSEPKRRQASEPAPEIAAEPAAEPEVELATEKSPSGAETDAPPLVEGNHLNLGEILFDLQPYLAIDLTLAGGAGGDVLRDQTPPLRDRGPRPDDRARHAAALFGRPCGRGPPFSPRRNPHRPTLRARPRGSGLRILAHPRSPPRLSGFRCAGLSLRPGGTRAYSAAPGDSLYQSERGAAW